MAHLPQYVQRQASGTYRFRRLIPPDLWKHYEGKKNIIRSLRTKDAATMRERAARETVRTTEEFTQARKAAQARPEQNEYVMGWEEYEARFLADEVPMESREDALEDYEIEQDRRFHADEMTVPEMAQYVFKERLKKMMEWAAQKQREDERNKEFQEKRAAYLAEQRMPVPVVPETPDELRERAAGKHLFRDAIALWENRPKAPGEAAQAQTRQAVRHLQQITGVEFIQDLTRQHGITLRDTLLRKSLTARTVVTYLTRLRTLLHTAIDHEWIKENVLTRIKVEGRENDPKQPLPLGTLTAIFHSPIYTENWRPPKRTWDTELVYWLPLLALYTGARPEELAQLAPQDVYEETCADMSGQQHKAWVIRITDKGEGQRTKTRSSNRIVPLHDEILNRGFIEFVQARVSQPRIFDKTSIPRRKTSEAFLKWFGQWLRNTLKVTDKTQTFYSFRHTFITWARKAGISEDVRNALTGHQSGSMDSRYGTYELDVLVDAMRKYQVPGLTVPPRNHGETAC